MRMCVSVASAVGSVGKLAKKATLHVWLMCGSDADVSVSGFLMRPLDPSWPMVSLGRADARQA